MSAPPAQLFEFNTKFVSDDDAFGTIAATARFGFAGALFKVGAQIRHAAVDSIHPAHRLSYGELSPFQKGVFDRGLIDFQDGKRRLPPVLPYETSQPGRPPLTATGILPATILFAVERDAQTVVVGPDASRGHGGVPVPAVLEFGGDTTIGAGSYARTVHIRPRPFMRPAMAAVSWSVFENSMSG